MDDLTITMTSFPGSRWILQGLERVITWANMSFNPSKSRSIVLKKGNMVDKFRFSISGTVIPTITEQPVKSLGNLFDSSLKDSAAIQKSNKELRHWVTKVDKSGLPGIFKDWIYQHSVLPPVLLIPYKGRSVAFFGSGWAFHVVLTALHCMGLVISCSCP